jgi:uncharacterized protein YxeA
LRLHPPPLIAIELFVCKAGNCRDFTHCNSDEKDVVAEENKEDEYEENKEETDYTLPVFTRESRSKAYLSTPS